VVGCTNADDAGRDRSVDSVVSTQGDTLRIHFSKSPTAAALSMPDEASSPETVERLTLPAEIGQAHIADVAALNDGRVALLLRDLHQVVIVRDGRVEGRFGRRGHGPGEFKDPLALEASESGFAVLDVDGVELFASDGSLRGRVRLPWLPDWSLTFNRRPLLYHQTPYQSGPEDLSRRISRHGPDFIVMASERSASAVPPAPGTTQQLQFAVLRLTGRTLTADSVASVRGPERTPSTIPITDRSGRPLTNIVPPVGEPLFGRRPLLAGSSDWLAVFDPEQNRVGVSMKGDSRKVLISWPDIDVPISDSERAHAVEWQNRDLVTAAPSDSVARVWARNARRQSFDQKLRASQSTPFSAALAPLAAMFATPRCLWLVGVDPRDFTDGTGHWGVAVDLASGAATGPFRLATRGNQLKDIGFAYAYSVGRTQQGEFFVERTPLPACAD
jgi:hypothetical protein